MAKNIYRQGVSSPIKLLDLEGINPTGTIILWAGSKSGATVPSGWLVCDGSAISRTTYATLFAAIGTTYGTGDGSTTFNLPSGTGGQIPSGITLTANTRPANVTSGVQSANHTHNGTSGDNSGSHTHNGTSGTESAEHVHNVSITTGNQSANHFHTFTLNPGETSNTEQKTTGDPSANHYHSGNFTTGAGSVVHQHNTTFGVQSANHTHNTTFGNQSASHTHVLGVASFCFLIKT